MTNLDSIFKSRDITLPTKFRLVKAMVFPVVMYGCESWTVKKAECRRIDAFELWCWRRLLRVPWTARRSNQSILKEISCGISLEGMMLKLKLQYFGHLMRRVESLERLMLGGTGGRRRRGRQRMRWLDGITDSVVKGKLSCFLQVSLIPTQGSSSVLRQLTGLPPSLLDLHHLMSRLSAGCPGPWYAVCRASWTRGESVPSSHSWYNSCTWVLASGSCTGMSA